ncbi:hypothetical protein F4823DRAFT_594722 [Ustulina deusta]|nr:hypothetical protein F4823DRAFT_594722 [Ustulina deusta]
MEGFAALGVAANIAQALEYGFKLLQKSRNLRELGVIDPDLNSDTRRLQTLAVSLNSQQLPKSHEDLGNLARECAKVSAALIAVLDELELMDPNSRWQRFKATVKSELKRNDIGKLEKRLDMYKTQLSLHLTSLSRTEFNGKLDEIDQDVQKIKSELAGMRSVTKGFTHIGQEISQTLQSLVQRYHDPRVEEQVVLDKLHFPDMHERVDTIPDAHKETLRWLLDSTADHDSAKGEAGKNFVTWLQHGSGFFHISGKLGAGKSTMMKYICSHKDLNRHLKVWCGGAQLGRGQFFFWKPGTAAQKSLKGLLRGLLHSILDTNRDLIPTAFPDLWKLISTHSASIRELEYRDFQQGFDNILKHATQSCLYKFVLFIDGLDEFEGRHLDLITTMKNWTEKYSSVLKICVSSREYSVFQVSFSPYPKLRLHEFTSTDIARMVSTHLKSNPQYVELFKSDQASQSIVNLITTRAEGVFLWVSIVLASIEDAIISGASLRGLEERIVAYPTELDPLYLHLAHLIHETDRKWAFRTLKMVQFFQSHGHYVQLGGHFKLGLLQLSFLEDMQYGSAAVPFSKASTLEPKTAMQRLDNTYKKVYGQCKGFLHVCARREPLYSPTMKQEVVFIHRSIVEFLETPSFATMAAPYISDFDCFDNACSALLQCVEYQRPSPDFFSKGSDGGLSLGQVWKIAIVNYSYLAAQLRRSASSTFISFLEALQGTALTLSTEVGASLEMTTRIFAQIWLRIGRLELLKRMQNSYPQFKFSVSTGEFLSFYRCGQKCCWSHLTQDQFIMIMDHFLRHGLDFNLHDGGHSHFSSWPYFSLVMTPWKMLIAVFMINMFPENWCPGVVIDWYLRQGADPDLTIGQFIPRGPHSARWLNPKDGWEVLSFSLEFDPFSRKGPRGYDNSGNKLLLMHETSHLCQRIRENGRVLKLRDLLSCWFPDNQYFPNLINELQLRKYGKHSDSTLLSNGAEVPPGKILRRTWETDYKVYSEDDCGKLLKSVGVEIAP